MAKPLSAHVILPSGDDFTAEVSNLTPRSLFLKTEQVLRFREQVTVTFFGVSVEGEVAICCGSPSGALIVFSAQPITEQQIRASMSSVEVLSGAYGSMMNIEEEKTNPAGLKSPVGLPPETAPGSKLKATTMSDRELSEFTETEEVTEHGARPKGSP